MLRPERSSKCISSCAKALTLARSVGVSSNKNEELASPRNVSRPGNPQAILYLDFP